MQKCCKNHPLPVKFIGTIAILFALISIIIKIWNIELPIYLKQLSLTFIALIGFVAIIYSIWSKRL